MAATKSDMRLKSEVIPGFRVGNEGRPSAKKIYPTLTEARKVAYKLTKSSNNGVPIYQRVKYYDINGDLFKDIWLPIGHTSEWLYKDHIAWSGSKNVDDPKKIWAELYPSGRLGVKLDSRGKPIKNGKPRRK